MMVFSLFSLAVVIYAVSGQKVEADYTWSSVVRITYTCCDGQQFRSTGVFVTEKERDKHFVLTSAELFKDLIEANIPLQWSSGGRFRLISTGTVTLQFGSAQIQYSFNAETSPIKILDEYVNGFDAKYAMALMELPSDAKNFIAQKGGSFALFSEDDDMLSIIEGETCRVAVWGSDTPDTNAIPHGYPVVFLARSYCENVTVDPDDYPFSACLKMEPQVDGVGGQILFKLGDVGAPVVCMRNEKSMLISMVASLKTVKGRDNNLKMLYNGLQPEFIYIKLGEATYPKY